MRARHPINYHSLSPGGVNACGCVGGRPFGKRERPKKTSPPFTHRPQQDKNSHNYSVFYIKKTIVIAFTGITVS